MLNFLGRNPKCSPSDCTKILLLPPISSTSIDLTLGKYKGTIYVQHKNKIQQIKTAINHGNNISGVKYHPKKREKPADYLLEDTFFTDKCVPLYSLCILRMKSYHLKS